MHDAVLRRQPVLDQMAIGLSSLGFLDLMKKLPATFEHLLVYKEKCVTAQRIQACVTFPESMNEKQKQTSARIRQYLSEAPEIG